VVGNEASLLGRDLRDGYYNVNLRKKDLHLTAVRTLFSLFEYAVMAHGLKGACPFFQKIVNEVCGFAADGRE
jgi:hypothetical protein